MSSPFAPVLIATAFAGAVLAQPAFAQQAAPAHQPAPRISVQGEGTVDVAPDMAIISLTVLRQAETAQKALAANSEAMREVLSALKAAGIAERDLQTSRFNIMPMRSQVPRDKPQEPKIVGYAVSNEVTVRIRKLDEAGSILDKVVGLGVNQGGDISFVKDDLGPTMTEARKRAVADAMERAKTLADAAGVKLGRILSISEGSSQPRPMPYAAPMRMAAEKAVPLASGENSYQAQVNLVIEIAP